MKVTSGNLSNDTVAIAADKQRSGLIISNTSDTVMTYHPNGTATAALGIVVAAGGNIILTDDEAQALIQSAGTLFCAGSSKTYFILEW